MTKTRIRNIVLAAIVATALSWSWGVTNSIAGDPSQRGHEARKVNEYEGQHRVGKTTMQDFHFMS